MSLCPSVTFYPHLRGAKQDIERTPKCTHLNSDKARRSTQGYFAQCPMPNHNDDDGNHLDSQGPPPTCCWSRRRRRQRDFPRRHSQS